MKNLVTSRIIRLISNLLTGTKRDFCFGRGIRRQMTAGTIFVLSYYGIGVIGKSSLIDQLCRKMQDKSKRYVKYEFEGAKGMGPYSILIDLKQSIRNRYADFFRFPLFNAELLLLAKKSNISLENDELVKSVVSESLHLHTTVNALSRIPVVEGYLQNVVTVIAQLSSDVDHLNVK